MIIFSTINCRNKLRVTFTLKGRSQVMSKPYPIKSHGKKTLILSYALDDLIEKFDLPVDVFDR